jgi:hypothetical protein
MWCIGEITPEYRQRMYALLDLYQFPKLMPGKLDEICNAAPSTGRLLAPMLTTN